MRIAFRCRRRHRRRRSVFPVILRCGRVLWRSLETYCEQHILTLCDCRPDDLATESGMNKKFISSCRRRDVTFVVVHRFYYRKQRKQEEMAGLIFNREPISFVLAMEQFLF